MDVALKQANIAWLCPDSHHYICEDGTYLVVTVANFFTATGTTVQSADRAGNQIELIREFPDGTSHETALAELGHTLVDFVDEAPDPDATVITFRGAVGTAAGLPEHGATNDVWQVRDGRCAIWQGEWALAPWSDAEPLFGPFDSPAEVGAVVRL